jgi:hypothetical protein
MFLKIFRLKIYIDKYNKYQRTFIDHLLEMLLIYIFIYEKCTCFRCCDSIQINHWNITGANSLTGQTIPTPSRVVTTRLQSTPLSPRPQMENTANVKSYVMEPLKNVQNGSSIAQHLLILLPHRCVIIVWIPSLCHKSQSWNESLITVDISLISLFL